MKPLILFRPVLVSLLISCRVGKSTSVQNKTKKESPIAEERKRLKEYAFCRCLANSYPRDTFLLKDGTIEGYMEMGSYGNRAYDVIDSFINLKCKMVYASKFGKKLNLMKCLDIYNNKDLDSIVNSLDEYNSYYRK